MAAWDEEFDLVCVGSGLGGLAAAVAGAEAGLSLAGAMTFSWLAAQHAAQNVRVTTLGIK